MDGVPCALCGVEAGYLMPFYSNGLTFFTPFYNCPKCGRFVLGEMLKYKQGPEKADLAFRLACLVRERRLRDEEGIFGLFEDDFQPSERTIDKELDRWWRVNELLSEFPKATEIIDRALLNLSRRVKHPMERLKYGYDELQFLMFCPKGDLRDQISFMKVQGVLAHGAYEPEAEICISPAGWQRIEELSKSRTESRQAFVAIWFDATMNDFEKATENAIQDEGFECRIIKNIEHNNDICDEIIAEIRKSRFIVADFTAGCCKKCETCEEHKTCRDTVRQRGGVYFEAGFALGLGIPVIWTVRKDQIEHIHFDTRQYSYIVYENAEELRQKLRNRIAATIH